VGSTAPGKESLCAEAPLCNANIPTIRDPTSSRGAPRVFPTSTFAVLLKKPVFASYSSKGAGAQLIQRLNSRKAPPQSFAKKKFHVKLANKLS
jgi:hypothetical protein